jgi:hypothetical protein
MPARKAVRVLAAESCEHFGSPVKVKDAPVGRQKHEGVGKVVKNGGAFHRT